MNEKNVMKLVEEIYMDHTLVLQYNNERKYIIMALAQLKTYTEEDYYSLPEDVRPELIDGQIYYMSAPSRIHKEI